MIQITLIACVNLFLTYGASKNDTPDDSIPLEYIILYCIPLPRRLISPSRCLWESKSSPSVQHFFQTIYFMAIPLASIVFSLKLIENSIFQIYIAHIKISKHLPTLFNTLPSIIKKLPGHPMPA